MSLITILCYNKNDRSVLLVTRNYVWFVIVFSRLLRLNVGILERWWCNNRIVSCADSTSLFYAESCGLMSVEREKGEWDYWFGDNYLYESSAELESQLLQRERRNDKDPRARALIPYSVTWEGSKLKLASIDWNI